MSGSVYGICGTMTKYKNSPATEPLGTTPDGSWIPLFHGRRGGKWSAEAYTIRISRRSGGSPWLRGVEQGFRLMRTEK